MNSFFSRFLLPDHKVNRNITILEIEKIIEIDLDDEEKEKLAESAQGVKATNSLLS